MALLPDLLSQELPELDRELAGRLGLVFCAVPQGNTAFDLVTGVPGTLTGTGIAQSLRARNAGFSSPDTDYDQALSLTGGVAADQIIWPVSASLRGATAVQEGTLLCLGGVPESGVSREYFFGASRDTNGDGPGLRIATGAVGPGQPGTIMRSRSASTALASSTTGFLGTTATTGLRTHFFGYSFSANGVDGTWFGARRSENWTARGAFGTGAGAGTRRAMLFTDYNNVAYNTKTAYLSLFLIFDKRHTVETYQSLYDEPQQLFKSRQIWVPQSAAGGATTKTITTSLSAAIQNARTATATINAGIQAGASTTATVNAVVQAAHTAQASLDAALQRVNQATAGLDVAVRASGTRVAGLDTAVQLARSATTALNVAVQAQRSTTTTINAQVQAAGSATSSLDAFVLAGSQVNVSVSAAILAAALRTAGIDAVVALGQTRTTSLNAALKQARSATAGIGAAVGVARAATTSLNAQIQISGATNVIAAIDTAVQRLTSAVVSIDAMISAAGSANAALNAVVSLQRSAAAAMSAAVLNTRSVLASLSAYVFISGEAPPPLHLLVTISLEQELRSIVASSVNQIDVTLSLDPSLGRVFVS